MCEDIDSSDMAAWLRGAGFIHFPAIPYDVLALLI